MNISFVIVSYKSYHLLEKHITTIPKENEIIIIENSLDINVKSKFEKLYSNVKVIIPQNNLGYGTALNLGLQKARNNFVMYMVSDDDINKECLDKLSGSIIGWKESLLEAGFDITNPQAKRPCGCGESVDF